jgi:HAE1 family hydrophobic/amphiphilic exporter-1
VRLQVDRIAAAEMGLAAADVAFAVNMLAGGFDIAKYNDDPGDGERYDVRVKAADGQLAVPADLRKIFLRSEAGQLVRLDTLAEIEETVGPAVISRYDLPATPPTSSGSPTCHLARRSRSSTRQAPRSCRWAGISLQIPGARTEQGITTSASPSPGYRAGIHGTGQSVQLCCSRDRHDCAATGHRRRSVPAVADRAHAEHTR